MYVFIRVCILALKEDVLVMFILIIICLQLLYDSLCFWPIYNDQTAEVTPNSGEK